MQVPPHEMFPELTTIEYPQPSDKSLQESDTRSSAQQEVTSRTLIYILTCACIPYFRTRYARTSSHTSYIEYVPIAYKVHPIVGGKSQSVEAIRMFEEDAKMKAERQEYAVCLAEYNERTNQNEFELGAVIERFWFAPGPGGTMAGTKPLASATIVGMRQFDGDSNEILPEPQVVYDIGSGPRLFVSFARMREIIRAGLAKVTSRTLYIHPTLMCVL